jgi:beta-lactamase regulating signal transducer with metallopeptidase domain/uncharacterized GH25 family protein
MQDVMTAASAALEDLPGALAHSLWQAALVALVVYAALRAIPARRAALRYGIAVTGLMTIVAAVLVTWSVLGQPEPGATEPLGVGTRVAAIPDSHVPAAASPSSPAAATAPRARSDISEIMLILWAAGVAVMLLRLSWLMIGVGALRRHSRPLDDPAVLALFSEIKALAGVSRRVALRVADDVLTPIAMGLLWPAIVLPASFASGVPPQQLRAILAHELAHIRRFDYLVNFFQLIIEALLYFNPAVWWVSRQIRIEREACCDAAAARALGDTLEYADALTSVTRYIHDGYLPSAAQGFGAHGKPDGALDRLRRLLLPEYRPHLRLRWYSVVTGSLLSFAILLGLYQSAELAKRLLTDTERIQVMADLAEVYQPPIEGEAMERIPIAVTVETYDGAPLPEDEGYVGAHLQRANYGSSHSLGRSGDRYRCNVHSGEAYITAVFRGYAPAVLGPLRIEADGAYEDLRLTLGPAHPARVRFVTESGSPIAGVEVTGGFQFVRNSWTGSLRLRSDDAGEVEVPQGEIPISVALRATAVGFQEAYERDLALEPDGLYEWVLYPDEPVAGIVVAKATGRPIPGARIALAYDTSGRFPSSADGKTVTVTDAQGQFKLGGLVDDRRYFYLAHAEGFGSEMFVAEGGQDQPAHVALAPRYVRGVVRGDLSLLKRSKDDGVPVVGYSMELSIPGEGSSHGGGAKEAPVKIVEGDGHFLIPDLRAGELFVKAGPEIVRIGVIEPVEDLVIHVGSPEDRRERTVVIHFHVPEGAPPAEGLLQVTHQEGARAYEERAVAIANGRAEFNVETPTRVRIATVRLNGYIVEPAGRYSQRSELQVDEAEEPLVVVLPLERAGAIEGQVLLADGSPAPGAHVYVRIENPTRGDWPSDYLGNSISSNVTCDAEGRFAVLPVPFDEEFIIKASIDFARAEKRVVVRADDPIVSVQLKLPDGVDVPVLVVDPNGTPMPEIEVYVSHPSGGHSGLRADSDGVFVLRGADPKAEFDIEARPTRDYRFTRVRVPFDGSQAILRLEEGLRLSGVVQRADTGEPVAHATVTAHAAHVPGSFEYRQYESKVITDGEGRFEFTNLCEGNFKVRANASHLKLTAGESEEASFEAGRSDPIVIQVHPDR